MAETLRILHLEDDPADAILVRRVLQSSSLTPSVTVATSREEFLAALELGPWDLVVSDNTVPNFSSRDAIAAVGSRFPATPVIVLSGAGEEKHIVDSFRNGAADYILKGHLSQLVIAIYRLRAQAALPTRETPDPSVK